MITDTLSRHITGFAVKRLTAVEAHPSRSNQHEFNGVRALKNLFGTDRLTAPARFIWLSDDDDDLASAEAFVTWYDARESHIKRTEHRLYFPPSSVMEKASEGDTVLIARRPDGSVLIIVAAAESSAEAQVLWLFGADRSSNVFEFAEVPKDKDRKLGAAATFLLTQLGITPTNEDTDLLREMVTRFERGFPTTKEFSEFARTKAGAVDATGDPDAALVEYMETEEQLFLMFERFLLSERLSKGLMNSGQPDVDGFIAFSLHVQNRRKARAGRALEHHVAFVLTKNQVRFSSGPQTENRSRPDFLFPSITEYHDPSFPSNRLTMLAAKSTCKDRWRQILAEARRIHRKHLLTFEPRITVHQTDEMIANNVQLVVPRPLQTTYADAQRSSLMSFAQFIEHVRSQQ